MRLVLIMFTPLIILVACSGNKVRNDNQRVDDFLDHLKQAPATSSVDDPAEKFLSLFGNLKLSDTREDLISQLYADDLYFNDTFKTIRTLDELVPYILETAEMVTQTTVEILDVVQSEEDYYIRWVMSMEFEVRGDTIISRSIGMTQVRFNVEGRIVLHQDYWDGAEAFYRHLPVVGYLIKKIQSRL